MHSFQVSHSICMSSTYFSVYIAQYIRVVCQYVSVCIYVAWRVESVWQGYINKARGLRGLPTQQSMRIMELNSNNQGCTMDPYNWNGSLKYGWWYIYIIFFWIHIVYRLFEQFLYGFQWFNVLIWFFDLFFIYIFIGFINIIFFEYFVGNLNFVNNL